MRAPRLPAPGLLGALVLAASLGCGGGSSGSGPAPRIVDLEAARGAGPVGIFLPEDPTSTRFPFPHDALTVLDPTSPSGRRLRLPTDGDTRVESEIRVLLNEEPGFDPFTPIQLSFDAPVDLDTLRVNRDPDPRRHSIFVFNVDPRSARFGERVPLDMGGGLFPVERLPRAYFPGFPLADVPHFLFDPANREPFYEDETSTLWLRPTLPMAELATHAVVITTRVRGEDGEPVRSPHGAAVALAGQEAQLDPVIPMLAELGVSPSQIAWTYAFTTGAPARQLERIHDGLVDGRGPLAGLRDRFPPRLRLEPISLDPGDDALDLDGDDLLLDPGPVEALARIAIPLIGATADDVAPEAVDQLVDFESIAYFVQGSFESPYFLSTAVGRFDVAELSGRIPIDASDTDVVPFFASVPRPTARNGFAQPPYDVAIFQHPSSTSRLVAVAVASIFADHGLATIGIDAAENGPIFPYAVDGVLDDLPFAPFFRDVLGDLETAIERVPLVDVIGSTGRTPEIDVNGDGRIRSGEVTFTADLPRVRDIFRQTSVDLMQLTRVLRALGSDLDGDGAIGRDEGDFDGDGRLDLGGPDVDIVLAGNSLGTFMGGPFLAFTREIERAAFNSPGAGGVDVFGRLDLPGTADQLFVQAFGPAIVGRLAPAGGVDVTLIDDLGDAENAPRQGPVDLPGGAVVELENLDKPALELRRVRAEDDGRFFVNIPADAGDRLRVRFEARDGGALPLPELDFRAERHGFGVRRNGPDFRNFATVTQNAAGASDGIHYAHRWILDPPPGRAPKQVLLQTGTDDFTVPTGTAITLARVAGLVSPERIDRLVALGIPRGNIASAGIAAGVPDLPLPPGSEARYAELDYDLTRTVPFESPIEGSGFVLHLVSNHEYLFAPSLGESGPVGAFLTLAAQEQMAIFLTEGRTVVGFEELLDALRARGRTIAPLSAASP